MKIYDVIKKIKKDELVNFLREELGAHLEEEQFADSNDVQQKVFAQYFSVTNKAIWVFSSDDEEHFIIARLDAYDYDLVSSENSFDEQYRKIKIEEKLETPEEHLIGRKKYFNFIANLIENEYGESAKEEYLKRASKKIATDEHIM